MKCFYAIRRRRTIDIRYPSLPIQFCLDAVSFPALYQDKGGNSISLAQKRIITTRYRPWYLCLALLIACRHLSRYGTTFSKAYSINGNGRQCVLPAPRYDLRIFPLLISSDASESKYWDAKEMTLLLYSGDLHSHFHNHLQCKPCCKLFKAVGCPILALSNLPKTNFYGVSLHSSEEVSHSVVWTVKTIILCSDSITLALSSQCPI